MKDLVINSRVTIPGREISIAFARSGGPGGQNVNKVSSKVELRWIPGTSEALGASDRRRLLEKLGDRLTAAGELVITCDETRDQHRNREIAREKLADLVRGGLARPRPRKKTKPSRAARQRRLDEKKKQSEKKRRRRDPDE